MTMAVLFAALTMSAQDDVFEKYSAMGDMNTTYVTKNMLERVPLDQFDVPGLAQMVERIENMKILVSRGDKAGKKLGIALPGQLKGEGFKVMQETKINEQNVTVMQSKKDPSKVAIIVYQKPQATAVYMKGNFEDLESDFSGLIQ
jgi:hypothetical protein